MGQANAVGPTSMEDSFSSVFGSQRATVGHPAVAEPLSYCELELRT